MLITASTELTAQKTQHMGLCSEVTAENVLSTNGTSASMWRECWKRFPGLEQPCKQRTSQDMSRSPTVCSAASFDFS